MAPTPHNLVIERVSIGNPRSAAHLHCCHHRMQAAIALSLALAASQLPAHASEMRLVPAEKRHCANWDSYCYEWQFTREKSLRFIAHGDEDGGLDLFYRRSSKGNYRALFSVHPAMTDARQ